MFMNVMPDPKVCAAMAKEFASGKSRDELVEFIGDMGFGIACIKQEIVNAKLFGQERRKV